VANRAQIVRDEQVRQVALALQLLDEVDDLRLNGERRARKSVRPPR
jgi:hypothetical protein